MRFEVAHLIRYTYERPVLLEPLIVRLRPRSDIFQRLVAFDLTVDPLPEGMSEMVDAEGNTLSQVWFLGLASMLTLRTTFAIETLRTNPFDYIVLDPEGLRMPMTYGDADRRALAWTVTITGTGTAATAYRTCRRGCSRKSSSLTRASAASSHSAASLSPATTSACWPTGSSAERSAAATDDRVRW